MMCLYQEKWSQRLKQRGLFSSDVFREEKMAYSFTYLPQCAFLLHCVPFSQPCWQSVKLLYCSGIFTSSLGLGRLHYLLILTVESLSPKEGLGEGYWECSGNMVVTIKAMGPSQSRHYYKKNNKEAKDQDSQGTTPGDSAEIIQHLRTEIFTESKLFIIWLWWMNEFLFLQMNNGVEASSGIILFH